jgi:hypothetical protein
MTRSDVIARIEETIDQIVDEDDIIALIASSNATDWRVAKKDISRVTVTNERGYAVITFTLKGDQKEDQAYAGNEIKGRCTAQVDSSGVSYSIVDANLI